MKAKNSTILLLSMILTALSIAACTNSSLDNSVDDDTIADDETAASMSAAEAGATYAMAEDLTEATGTTISASLTSPASSSARESVTINIVAGARTFAVSYYDQLDGTGNLLGSTPGTIPVDTLSAVITSVRPYSVVAPRGDSSVTVTTSIVVNNILATTGLWGIKGSFDVVRDITRANGTIVNSTVTHSIDYSVAATNSTIENGGTATTTATTQINGGPSFGRNYTWTFNGDGTAVMTTQRGSTLTVTLD